jgi:hypothetical protein
LVYKLCKLLSRQNLCKSISGHTISRYLFDINARGSDLLLNPELVDVNVLNLCIKLVVLFCNNTNSLLVVTLDCRSTVKHKVDASEEMHLLFHLQGCKGEQEQFRFCS